MACRLWLPTLGFLVLFSAPALAQKTGRRAADTLFREGREAFDKGDFARACPKFAESQRLDPAAGTLLNLAVCEERLGQLLAAREHLMALLPQLAAGDERAPFAKDLLAKLDGRLAHLTLALAPGAPAETEVKDAEGQRLAIGAEITLEPGDRALTVTAPGRAPSQLRLTLTAGQRETREVAPQPLPSEAPGPGQGAPSSAGAGKARAPSGLQIAGIASASVGVAALGIAAVSGVVLLSRKAALEPQLEELCPNKQCTPAGWNVVMGAKADPLVPLNYVSWALAIVGMGAGATLVILTREKAPDAPKASAFVTPLPGGGGFGVQGTF